MSVHTTPGRRYVSGQTVANSARRLNEPIDKLSRVERDQRTFSNAVKRKVGGGGDYRVVRFRLKGVYDDYLECRQLNGTTETGPTVKVAKPYNLRKAPFHGKTINGITYTYASAQVRAKTRTSPSATETQAIVPAYLVAGTNYDGDEIYACKPSGGTGVKIGGVDVVWLDINNAGRAWAKVTT
jgi:hypothetical protein